MNKQKLKWIGLLLVVITLVVVARYLPILQWLNLLKAQLLALGVLGMILFCGIYAIATVLFIPGAAITVFVGAIFGVFWGTFIVAIGATLGAALAFLIARYLAREKIKIMAANNPKFSAIDTAISKGGWKIVALLRLSPAVPFNLINYLLGLTAVSFFSYTLASAIFMLPGTFMYVYLGHIGQTGLQAMGKTTYGWILQLVGFLATVGVVVYTAKLASQEIKAHVS